MTKDEKEAKERMDAGIAAQSRIEREVRQEVAALSGAHPDLVTIRWLGLQCVGSVTRSFSVDRWAIPSEVSHG